MRVVYYCRTCFLDHVIQEVEALSRLVELHLVVEFSPESRFCNIVDWQPGLPSAGIFPGMEVFDEGLPARAGACFRQLAGLHVVNHTCPRSVHPSAWRVSAKAAALIRGVNPDVLHMDDTSLRMAPLLRFAGSAPLVVTVHDVSSHLGEEDWRTTVSRRLSFGKASAFILRNKGDADAFRAEHAGGTPVVEIPMGTLDIFREWATEGVAEEPATVLFFGRLSPYKGLEVFYDAARRVARELPDVRFLAAGRPVEGYEPPDPPVLAGRSEFEMDRGHVSNAKLAELFQRATVVVLPYLEATQSGVLLTAYAFRKPVIATAVGGLPEFVDHGGTGLLVAPGDDRQLAAAIVDLLKAPGRRAEMKARIAERARTDLCWEKIADRMAAIYEGVAAGDARRSGGRAVWSEAA